MNLGPSSRLNQQIMLVPTKLPPNSIIMRRSTGNEKAPIFYVLKNRMVSRKNGNGIPMSADTVKPNMAASPEALSTLMEAASVASALFNQSIIVRVGLLLHKM
jgi:hypothetical protein